MKKERATKHFKSLREDPVLIISVYADGDGKITGSETMLDASHVLVAIDYAMIVARKLAEISSENCEYCDGSGCDFRGEECSHCDAARIRR